MSKYVEAKKLEKQRRQARRKTVMIITIVLVVLGVAGLVWFVVSTLPKPQAAAAADCQVAEMQFTSPPDMQIDTMKQYFATVKMAIGGEFVIQLYPDKAPVTVNSFVFLARKGYFNCVTFHRVIEGFMAQGGDPTGTGAGGPGYTFINEANDLAFDKAGVVGMANAGPGTNGSQFFITFGPAGLAEADFTIFGQVVSGMDVVDALTRRDPSQNPGYPGDTMQSITITEK